MKAALDIVLFFATVYDYFWGKNVGSDLDEPQPDIPNRDIEHDYLSDNTYPSDGYKRFHSV